MRNRTLEEIWIYPVKSLGGIRVSTSKVMPKGLQYDRRWMLIDSENQFMTQRVHHQLALFKCSIDGDNLSITIDGAGVMFPLSGSLQGAALTAKIWDDTVVVHEVDLSISAWFSQHLNQCCRFVAFPEENVRPVDERYAIKNDQVSLADGYPLLLIGRASLDDLNARLPVPVPMNRFRPNLVFSGGDPYEEDEWRTFAIGKNKMQGVKRCARCVVTTIDQNTGVKDREPLLTLSRYRREHEKIYFGRNVIAVNYDNISEGDDIFVE